MELYTSRSTLFSVSDCHKDKAAGSSEHCLCLAGTECVGKVASATPRLDNIGKIMAYQPAVESSRKTQ
jgi:hypothetical protein